VDARVAFYAHARDRSVYFTVDGVTFDLRRDGSRFAVCLDFVGGRPGARPRGKDPGPTLVSYLKGPRGKWRTGLHAFAAVEYRDLWPGIDLVYEAVATGLKYRFVVHPGADPGRIRLRWRGAASVALEDSGGLAVMTPLGAIRDDRPVSWQERAGGRAAVPTDYALGPAAADGSRVLRFRLGDYDHGLPLVIDPAAVMYAGFLGGLGDGDEARGVAVDTARSAYVTGVTNSDDFPATVGAFETSRSGDLDAFVAKVLPAGTGFAYVTFLGGSAREDVGGIAVDTSGEATIAGATYSDETTFPVTVGPELTFACCRDAFIARLNASGTGLVYCGYISTGSASGVALDASGSAYVTGYVFSGDLPALVGPDLTGNGGFDAYVAKVKADGSGLDYCGYIGGAGTDQANGIAVTPGGVAFVVGLTLSDETTFPVAAGPDLTYNGASDGFVARVKADGSSLDYCGYLGGPGPGEDYVNAVAVDALGNAYLTGHTTSTSAPTFPVAVGPDLTINGTIDAFVAKVNAAGTALVYCGYIGGEYSEEGYGIAVDGSGRAVVCGTTSSHEGGGNGGGFPVTGGPGLRSGGDQDAFVARVSADGAGFDYSGFLGGSDQDVANAVALDAAGNAYVVGVTYSTESSFPVAGGPDRTASGATDAFVAKIVPARGSFLLPKKVTVRLDPEDPAKNTLLFSGTLDTGSRVVDLSAAGTLDIGVGGYVLTDLALAASSNGRMYRFQTANVDLSVGLSPAGSSRASFKVKVTNDLTGIVDPDGPLVLEFLSPTVDAASQVTLAGGGFALGRLRGALAGPDLYVLKSKATLKGGGEDSLALTAGFSTDGTTPDAAPDVTVGFGDTFTATIPAGSFVRNGDRFEFRGDAGGVTQVVIDYAKETVTLKGKGLDLGAFGDGPVPVVVTVGLDADLRAVLVRMGRKGSGLVY